MHIDEIISTALNNQQTTEKSNQFSMTLSDLWAQGRTVFGGISGGLAYLACKPLVEDDRTLRSFTVNFVGPIAFDTPFLVKAELLRSGKNVAQLDVYIEQNGNICLRAMACFGVSRSSKISVMSQSTHAMSAPQKAKFIPQIPKVTPRFLRHFDLSIESGGVPFLNSKKSHYHGWMKFSKTPSVLSDVHLITLIDAWPPTILQMVKGPAPASSVSWNMEFFHPVDKVNNTSWLAYQADTIHAADGYGHTEANIWDDSGRLLAVSRQTVAVFD